MRRFHPLWYLTSNEYQYEWHRGNRIWLDGRINRIQLLWLRFRLWLKNNDWN